MNYITTTVTRKCFHDHPDYEVKYVDEHATLKAAERFAKEECKWESVALVGIKTSEGHECGNHWGEFGTE